MRVFVFSVVFVSLSGFAQGPFSYWAYEVNPINKNQLLWDNSNPDNLVWQYGFHHKPFFGDSINKVLVTDTTYMYDSLVDASVDLILTRPNLGYAYALKFDHKLDTDSSTAGGFLEFNLDGDSLTYIKNGDTLKTYWLKFLLHNGDSINEVLEMGVWYNLVAENGDTIDLPDEYSWDNFYHHINGYHDTLFDQHVGFTGTYNEWESFYMELFFYEGFVKTTDENYKLICRFNFKSDSTSSGKNGWAIKNIESGYTVHPTGSIDENSQADIVVTPNPATDHIVFHEKKGMTSMYTEVGIFSVRGQWIESVVFEPGLVLDVSSYQPGQYFYLLVGDDPAVKCPGRFVKL